jgi:hypothetical protein
MTWYNSIWKKNFSFLLPNIDDFSYIVAVSFIHGGNWRTRRKPPTCRKLLSIIIIDYEYLQPFITLFSIKINSLAKALNNIEGSLYVDDFLICYRGKNMNTNPISKRSVKMPYFHVVSYAFSRSKKIDTVCSFLENAFRIKASKRTRWSKVFLPWTQHGNMAF